MDADDTLTEIRDEQVAEMEQRDFDELVEGLGPSRTLAGGPTRTERWNASRP